MRPETRVRRRAPLGGWRHHRELCAAVMENACGSADKPAVETLPLGEAASLALGEARPVATADG